MSWFKYSDICYPHCRYLLNQWIWIYLTISAIINTKQAMQTSCQLELYWSGWADGPVWMGQCLLLPPLTKMLLKNIPTAQIIRQKKSLRWHLRIFIMSFGERCTWYRIWKCPLCLCRRAWTFGPRPDAEVGVNQVFKLRRMKIRELWKMLRRKSIAEHKRNSSHEMAFEREQGLGLKGRNRGWESGFGCWQLMEHCNKDILWG